MVDELAGPDVGLPTHLGGDVWLTVGNDIAPEVEFGGRLYLRFMDRLLIPEPTSHLALESILAINRWRERLLARTDLPHRTLVRRLTTAACLAIGPGPMIEIGCGKFPFGPELGADDYTGIDIDPEALAHGRNLGLCMASDPGDVAVDPSHTATVVSMFAFQFPLSDSIAGMLRATREECVFVLNLPTKDDGLVAERLAMLRSAGFNPTILDLMPSGAHDRLIFASRPAGLVRCRLALEAARKALSCRNRCEDGAGD